MWARMRRKRSGVAPVLGRTGDAVPERREEETASGVRPLAEPRTLAWESNLTRELARLAWPIAVANVSYSLMTLSDTLFVAQLGPDALAGVGVGGIAAFTLLCFFLGGLRGVKVLVAQSVGAGRREEGRSFLGAGMLTGGVAGVVLVGLAFALAQALPLLTASAAAGVHAQTYLWVRMLGSPAFLVYVAVREHRFGVGDSRSPMVAAVAGNVTNIGLDALFIYGFGWGVAGAAAATVVGHVVEMSLVVYAQRADGGFAFGAVRMRHYMALLRTGLPTGLQFLLEVGSFAILTALLAALSSIEVAAHQAAIQAIHFTFLPVLAVADAGAVLSGQAVGARRDELVKGIAYRGMAIGSVYALSWTILLACFAPIFATPFGDDPALRAAIVRLFYVAAAFQLLDAAQVIARCTLQGTGDVRYPAVVGVLTAWLMTPPATYVLGYRFGLGAFGGWLGISAEITICATVLWARLLRNGWHPSAERTRAEVLADGEAATAASIEPPLAQAQACP